VDKRDKKKLEDKIRNSAATRVVLQSVDDASKMQTNKAIGLEGELVEGIERFQNYGFSSSPLPGTEIIAVPVGGDRSHLVAVGCDDRNSRLKDVKPGEVAMYSHNGDYIRLNSDNKLEAKTKESVIDSTVKSEFKSPQIAIKGAQTAMGYDGGATTFNYKGDMHIDGNLYVSGTIIVSGDVVAGGISLRYHTHPGDSGGTTGPPQ
jgi:phage baseplate assembly protein V